MGQQIIMKNLLKQWCRKSLLNTSFNCLISTDTAYSCDPRIKKFKEEEKARKESEKKAKADAKRREQEEKERVSFIALLSSFPFSLLLSE